MKNHFFLTLVILMMYLTSLHSQSYDMWGSGAQNQILKVSVPGSFGSTMKMAPSVIYEYNNNIGIGTNQPTEKLHVAGNILVDNDISATNIKANILRTPSILKSSTSNRINLSASTANNRFLLLDNGNFSIGDIQISHINYDSKLEVISNEESKPVVSIVSNAGSLGYGLNIKTNSTFAIPLEIQNNQNDVVFQVNGFGDIEFLGDLTQDGTEIKPSKWIETGNDIYFNTGKVGVGFDGPISSPNTKLHLFELGSSGPTLRLENYIGIPGSPNHCWDIENDQNKLAISHGNGTLGGSNPTMQKLFTINENGNVGIGSETPTSKLTVSESTANTEWLVDLYNNNDNSSDEINGMRLNFKDAALLNPDNELFAIEFDLNDKSRGSIFKITPFYTGINKPNPSYTLDVGGDINFSGNLKYIGDDLAMWLLNPTNDTYTTANVGIGTGTPESKLHVSIPANDNEKAIIIGNNSDRSLFIAPQVSAGGHNLINQDDDFGIYWNDGLGANGKNGTAGLVIAPHANPHPTEDIYGLRIDEKGDVEVPQLWAKEIIVDQTDPWYDFVFEDDYKLRSLSELEQFININKHLPDIPSEKEVQENGINVAEMNGLLLKKVEELTLYIIELEKRIDDSQNK